MKNELAFKWEDRNLSINGIPVAAIYTHEGRPGYYAIFSDLPIEEPDNIKGIKAARKLAEQIVAEWIEKLLTPNNTKS